MRCPGSGQRLPDRPTTPAESVKIEDAAAVPDEWVELERVPKKREIAKLLKGMRDAGQPMPNWGDAGRGEAKLAWRAVKKSHG